jgi:hypothetical protein
MTGLTDAAPARAINGKHVNGFTNGHTNGHTNGAVEPSWKKISTLKQGQREKHLAARQSWRLKEPVSTSVKDVSSLGAATLTERERTIVRSDATDLVLALRNSQYSSVEVTTAFCKVRNILPIRSYYRNTFFRLPLSRRI